MATPGVFAKKVIELIAPSIGDFLAEAKVLAACNMAKIEIDKLDKSNAGIFADKLEATLVASVGAEASKALKAKIMAL